MIMRNEKKENKKLPSSSFTSRRVLLHLSSPPSPPESSFTSRVLPRLSNTTKSNDIRYGNNMMTPTRFVGTTYKTPHTRPCVCSTVTHTHVLSSFVIGSTATSRERRLCHNERARARARYTAIGACIHDEKRFSPFYFPTLGYIIIPVFARTRSARFRCRRHVILGILQTSVYTQCYNSAWYARAVLRTTGEESRDSALRCESAGILEPTSRIRL